jgi:anti-sigma regulatory factor (Ser/Thr protein kinase)
MRFRDHDEREFAVDKVVNSALRTANLTRHNVAALDWAVNEITDNVLTHAKSKVGGFIICNKISRQNIIEFAVADCGLGIATTLGVDDERQAVELAVQEGVTRDKSTNQGNGLYGTYRLGLASSGVFVLKSKHGILYVNVDGETHVRRNTVPFRGTYLVCQVDCSNPDLIDRAFVFGGKAHSPAFDYLERKHEGDIEHQIVVKAQDICKTFGSRKSGEEARQYIVNLMNCYPDRELILDFSEINVISSSFADEVFGKLFIELGPMHFMRAIKLRNTGSAVEGLVDRAIRLRSQTGI